MASRHSHLALEHCRPSDFDSEKSVLKNLTPRPGVDITAAETNELLLLNGSGGTSLEGGQSYPFVETAGDFLT
jgi:hypothetical protein